MTPAAHKPPRDGVDTPVDAVERASRTNASGVRTSTDIASGCGAGVRES